MRFRRYLVVSLTLTLVSVLGGCILDSGDGCRNGNLITGCICDMAGQPMRGIKIRAFFDPMEGIDPAPDCSTYTALGGYYQIAYPPGASEVHVYPVRDGCVFSPYGRSYNEPTGALTAQSFVGYCGETYEVSGHVQDETGHDLAGIFITARDTDGFWRDDTVTDALGAYVLDGMAPNVDYVVTPSGYCDFTPRNRTYYGVASDLTGQDFTAACAAFHRVAGYVVDAQGLPLEGVAIETYCICHTGLQGHSRIVYTDAAGYYSLDVFTDPACGCYVIPKSDICHFLPHYRVYSCPEEDLTGENYTAYCGDGYDIDGHVLTPAGDPCEGTYLHMWRWDFEGQESEYIRISTDQMGYYKFDNLVPGVDYHIMPSTLPYQSGDPCNFEPPERTYSGLDGDKQDQDFVQDCPE